MPVTHLISSASQWGCERRIVNEAEGERVRCPGHDGEVVLPHEDLTHPDRPDKAGLKALLQRRRELVTEGVDLIEQDDPIPFKAVRLGDKLGNASGDRGRPAILGQWREQ